MDDIFITKVCSGDRDAFRYFVAKYKDIAFTVAISVVKDNFIAQEVVQDAFIKAYKNLQSYKGKSSFKTWFYRIVVNESLSRLKKEQKEQIYFTEELNEESITEHSMVTLNDDEQTYIINESLNRLPPKESLALRLFYLEEESIKNVCELTGWSSSNTKVILHRARKNMLLILNQIMKKEI